MARLTVLIVSALLVAACNTTATGGRDSKLSWWKKIPVENLIINVSDIPEINLSDAKQKSIGRIEIRQIVGIGEADDGFVEFWQNSEGVIHPSYSAWVKQQGNMDSWIKSEFKGEKFHYEESIPIEGLGRIVWRKRWIHKGRIG